MSDATQRRLVVGITGATGAVYGARLVEVLRDLHVEVHLVVSDGARKTLAIETGRSLSELALMSHRSYRPDNLAAAVSSGSFQVMGMVIAPCSMKTLAGISCGYSDNLITRAASVQLKERRKLVLLTRESPLSSIDLENMLRVSRAGAVVAPPSPAFYVGLKSIEDMVDHTIGRVLDQFDIEHTLVRRWGDGTRATREESLKGG